MSFDWTVVLNNDSLLLAGLAMSLAITAVVLASGAVLGLALCAARLSGSRPAVAIARGYITFFRITPEIVLIFWVYFCFPPLFDLRLSAWISGTLALGLVAAAYLAEIYRAGIEAVRPVAARTRPHGPISRDPDVGHSHARRRTSDLMQRRTVPDSAPVACQLAGASLRRTRKSLSDQLETQTYKDGR